MKASDASQPMNSGSVIVDLPAPQRGVPVKKRSKATFYFVIFHFIISYVFLDGVLVNYLHLFDMNIFLIINIAGVLAIISFYKSWKSDPGFVDYNWYESYPTDYLSTLQFCSTCQIPRPPRSSHCKDLGRCILRYDHFCPWIANAVGLQNHKYFILLICYAMIASCLEQFVMVHLLLNHSIKVHWSFLVFFLENGIVSLSIFLLVMMTLAFQAFNITTKEFYAWRNRNASGSTFPLRYDNGFYSNFVHILGPDPIAWWSPFSNEVILKEGYYFQ